MLAVNYEYSNERAAEVSKRVLEEFKIGLGDMLGIAADGLQFEEMNGKNGVVSVTLIGYCTREQADRILR